MFSCCLGKKSETPSSPTQPSQDTVVITDIQPTEDKTKEAIANYVDKVLPMPTSTGGTLEELVSGADIQTIRARALLRQQMESAMTTLGSAKVYKEHNQTDLLRFVENDKGKGNCDFSASELSTYLAQSGISGLMESGLIESAALGGNHAFLYKGGRDDQRLVVDPTWQQFCGKLDISPEGLPKVLIGKVGELAVYLKNLEGEESSIKALMSLYRRA